VAAVAEIQLVIVEGADSGREFDLGGAIIVGRDESAGIVIADAEASRKHASLTTEGASLTVEDLGSTNGTFVNGERLSAARTVGEGDRVRVGTTVFEVRALTQATRVGTAIPEEPEDAQATRVGGTAIPDFDSSPPASPEPAAPEPAAPEPVGSGAPGGAPPPSFPPPAAETPGGGGAPPPSFPPPGGPTSGGPPPGAAPAPGTGTEQFPPPGQPPAPYAGATPAVTGYPIEYEADYPSQGISRWRCFFQGFLALPHFFVLAFVLIGMYFAFIYAWFAILFTRRYPPGAFSFISGVLRWAHRVNGYTYLMTERYPPFSGDDDPSYPVRVRFRYPEAGISRWRCFFQGLLAIPHFVVLWFVGIGAAVGFFIAWFSILFTRNYPPGIFNFLAGALRWNARVGGYMLLMTEEYPPFALE
jgi:hypothetical protein